MAEMSTGGKVALGVGITLALAGVGVGLYFVFRKPKTQEQQDRCLRHQFRSHQSLPQSSATGF